MKSQRYRLGGLLAAGALTGAILTGAVAANAATNSTPPVTPSGTGTVATAPAGHNPDETLLTGTDAQKATAAALKAVPGGTVNRVETDSGDATYEAHITKADGSLATVKMNKNFTVTAVETGMGK